MKHFFTKFMMTAVLVMSALSVSAQQLPDPGFEDWSGDKFEGNIQPKYWHYSNLSQFGQTLNYAHKEAGRTDGSCAMVQNQDIMGNISPGYFTLGNPWTYVPSLLEIPKGTGGTDGGINFSYRPDSMYVWIKRTGSAVTKEPFSILFYSWKGTAKGSAYTGKGGGCTSASHTDEESDIRQALDANACGTTTTATQVAEGWYYEKKEYSTWTQIKIPIYYFNDEVPAKTNVIFAAAGYPNFRNADGMNTNNPLYVDDVELIYSSKIQYLYVGGKRWDGFDPNSTEEQVYSVGQSNDVPEIYAVRGAGSLSNFRGTVANFNGRKLSGNEISINYGKVDGDPTVITVKSGDGKSTTTYKIKMTKAASTNAKLKSILVNGSQIEGFNPSKFTYDVALPYGTTAAPTVTVEKAEDKQSVSVTQATSVTGKATIIVTAADNKTKSTYTLNFSVAQLADNTLKGIKVNGNEIMDFVPSLTVYTVELPVGTTVMPTVEAISAYPAGAQTIKYEAPDKIDGGQYKISVTTPGNQTAKVYKLNFVLRASTNSKLKNLQMEGYDLEFSPTKTTYRVTLPMGTTELPTITWEKGDPYQTVTPTYGGVDGTTTIVVTAASGDKTTYYIICSTEKSEASHLNMIYINGTPLAGFDPNVTTYNYALTPGTTQLPTITYDKGDPYEDVTITYGGLNGTTRITVVAGNGNTTIYKITFSLELDANVTLKAIFLDGKLLDGFNENVFNYQITLPRGTTELPAITWTKADESQTVTPRYGGVNGDTKLTVRAQSGASAEYTLKFSVFKDTINYLNMIYLDGKPLPGFHKDTLRYIDSLPVGVSKIPAITYDRPSQVPAANVKVLNQGNQRTVRVTAESGAVRDYVISFIISKSESAFPKMIYVDGEPLPGFDPKELEYSYYFEGETAPTVTVEKDGEQQVIILTPVGEGDATIVVLPAGGGEGNTYVIHFHQKPKAAVQLSTIMLDGVLLDGFSSALLDYTIDYFTDELPEVTYVAASNQHVDVFNANDKVRLVVTADGDQAIYTISFNRVLSSDATLAAIKLNGELIEGFAADQLTYEVTLPAGSVIPEITYTPNHAAQTVLLGQTGDKLYALNVRAEDGTTAAYTISFTYEQSDAELLSLTLNGEPLELEQGVYTYEQIIDAGAELPELGFELGDGQTILAVNTSDTQQQIIIKSDDGHTSTYTINYNPIFSSDAQLIDIKLDGVSLEDFDKDTYNYTHTLPWRTTVVPVIQPVGATPSQTIEIQYGAINAKTHIHVTAADKETTADYYIDFPVIKSGNDTLQSVTFDDLDFDFDPATTDYLVMLPYKATAVPQIRYTAGLPEQTIKVVNAPLSDTTRLIVTAENGDKREYKFAFKVTPSPKPNILDSIFYTYETKVTAEPIRISRKVTESESDITIKLPYATKAFTIDYQKNFDEQTVLVQPGGIFRPTVITVKSNRDDEEDKVYTITPDIEQQDPAVLQSITIKVGGTPIEFNDFDKNRFSYIVRVTGSPIVSAKGYNGADCAVVSSDSKHWQAEVTKYDEYDNEYKNTYDIWFYYPSDVIPNNEFTEWTNASTFTDAQKPKGWNTIADALSSHYVFLIGTFKPSSLLSKDGSSVHLMSKYSNPGGGNIPGWITLGNASGEWGVAGSSNFAISGGITFRNTPDEMQVSAKIAKIKEHTQIIYTLVGSTGTQTLEWGESQTTSGFETYTYKLAEANAAVGAPSLMNIVLNSYYQVSGTTGNVVSDPSDMYVDWVKFVYHSTLTGLQLDGEDATLDGNKFTYTLPSPDYVGVPALKFIGKVSDQAQYIDWKNGGAEDNNRVRKATITNYAEDGTYTTYDLEITRPASTVATLSQLMVDGSLVTDWDPEVTEYTIPVPCGQKRIFDVCAIQGSNYQTVATSRNGNKVTVTVTPESGEAKTYTVTFAEQKSNDVTLEALLATGVTYDPETTEYNVTAEALPGITFVKKTDGQTVILENGVLHITAEDGVTKGTITITNTLPTTTGQLADLSLDGITVEGFAADNYRYPQPQPEATSFIREFTRDSVLQIITPDSITWKVIGTEQHTYTLVYPTNLSPEAKLAGIKVNGELVDDFVPADSEYNIYLPTEEFNAPVRIDVVPNPGQKVTVAVEVQPITAAPVRQAPAQQVGLLFTLTVTAEDGSNTMTYNLTVLPQKSSDATLKMIRLDGEDIEGFAADQTRYVITLPSANPKLVEPKTPSVTYIANQYAQIIEAETYLDSDTTYNTITVKAEDGLTITTYEVLITSERSRNADITALMLDGKMLENFSPERTYYSALVKDLDVEVTYSAADRFLTIDTLIRNSVLTLHVVAQDTTVHKDYVVELYTQSLSADVSLATILLDGKSFTEYDPTLIPFNPMNSYYTIPLATNQARPEVSARLNHPAQTMSIDLSKQDTVLITVQAEDKVHTNTYVIYFKTTYSSDTQLAKLEVGDDELQLVPGQHDYTFVLPVGEKQPRGVTFELKDYDLQSSENENTDGMQWSVDVIAQDGTRVTYTVTFVLTLSQNALLSDITANDVTIEGFRPEQNEYVLTLPMGERKLPEIKFYAGDEWQRPQVIDTLTTGLATRYACTVLAEDSIHRSIYKVDVLIQPSDVDTLVSINVDHRLLEGFDPHQANYTYKLPSGTTELPLVEFEPGDEFQTIDSVSTGLNGVMTILVTAENGSQRRYAIRFEVERSNNATLDAIFCSGNLIDNFDPETYDYTIILPYGTTEIPVVTFNRNEPEQQAEMTVDGDKVTITVTAADGSQQTYTLTFQRSKSSEANLAAITLDGELLEGFSPDTYDYTVILPYGTTDIPDVTATLVDSTATITEIVPDGQTVTISTLAADGRTPKEYTITFVIEGCPYNFLTDIQIKGVSIEGFEQDTLYYLVSYPVGSDSTVFATINDVTYVLGDSTETVSVSAADTWFYITVLAQNGDSRVYMIEQQIPLNNNSLLADITLNGTTINNFADSVLTYEYLLLEGQNAPLVEATAQDPEAEVSVTPGAAGEPTLIYCTAQDGSETVYSITFAVSPINTSLDARSTDVLLKQVGDQFAAFSIRVNTNIAIYDNRGQKILDSELPVCDPNDVIIAHDPSGREILIDATGNGVYFTLPAQGQTFFYLFYSGKERIASGKFMVQ